jgi:hypothetical protein
MTAVMNLASLVNVVRIDWQRQYNCKKIKNHPAAMAELEASQT